MIVAKIVGGLGNQLFIYAFCRSLAHDLDEELYLDISRYGYNIHADHLVYGLQPFNIKGIVGNYPIESYPNRSKEFFKDEMVLYQNGGNLTKNGRFYKNLLFDNMKDMKLPAFITGDSMRGYNDEDRYVITENFFKHNSDIIREDFRFMVDIDDMYKDIAEDMKNYDSIALHLRRGNYIKHPEFGMCSPKYFNDAIEEIVKDLDNPKFYVVSEDYDWFKECVTLNYPYEWVPAREDKMYMYHDPAQVLNLMSLCDHFIISNSTFSWWASWLGKNPNKKIITPKPWFQSRDFLEAETISGIKPISITNNYEEFFNQSNNTLYKLSSDGLMEVKNTAIKFVDSSLHIKTLSSDSNLVLNKKFDTDNPLIIKMTIKSSNVKDRFLIYHKRAENEIYDPRFSYTWYYENEEFTHYVILTHENMNYLMIKPASTKDVILELKDFEVRELNENIHI